MAEESEDGDSEGAEEVEDQDSNEDSDTVAQSKIVTKKISKTKGKKSKLSPPSSQASESEEEEGWGKKKSDYYSSNAAQLESDDEEANELEEQEAKKLQAKVRDTLGEDDFGLGDAVEDAPEPEEYVSLFQNSHSLSHFA